MHVRFSHHPKEGKELDFPHPKAKDILGQTPSCDSNTGGRKQETRRPEVPPRERMRETQSPQIEASGPLVPGQGVCGRRPRGRRGPSLGWDP